MKQKINIFIFWQQWKGLLLNATSMGGMVILGIYLGFFQLSELGIYDLFVRVRPQEKTEDRVVIVTIDEDDIKNLQQWPINDENLTKVLQQIIKNEPVGIGIDLFRDLPANPGEKQLNQLLQATPNIIGVEKLPIRGNTVLESKKQLALADIILDSDGKVRRALLATEKDNEEKIGLGAKMALMYLEKKRIKLETIDEKKGIYKLGKVFIKNLDSNSGGYVRSDTGGYQILINYRGVENKFVTVKFRDVLTGNFDKDLFNNSIVFIGTTAESIKDWFTTPYNTDGQQTSGIVIHANIASQLIGAALDERKMINVLPKELEWLWVLIWAGTGAIISAIILEKTLYGSNVIVLVGGIFLGVMILGSGLIVINYVAFLNGFWISTAAPFTALVISTLASAGTKTHQLYRLAILDGLTQISNRRFFDEQIHRWWWRLMLANKPLSILMCDVDFFKPYNDTYGHQAGDKCLQAVAKAIRQSVRGTDMVARYGGEEFVVILPNTDTENALKVAERMRLSIKQLKVPHRGSKVDEFVSISCGLATIIPHENSSPTELISRADGALYQAKQQGRDRVVISDG